MGLENGDTALMCNHHPSLPCFSFSLTPSCSDRCFPSAPRFRGPWADEFITQITIQQPRGRGGQGKHTSISRYTVQLSPSSRDSPWEFNHEVMAAVRRAGRASRTPQIPQGVCQCPCKVIQRRGAQPTPELGPAFPARLNSCRTLRGEGAGAGSGISMDGTDASSSQPLTSLSCTKPKMASWWIKTSPQK